MHKLARILHKNARSVNAKKSRVPKKSRSLSDYKDAREDAGWPKRSNVISRPTGSTRVTQGQTKQGAIVGARQSLLQPPTKLFAIDLALPEFIEHDAADEYLAASLGLAFPLHFDCSLARVQSLLPQLQLAEPCLQSRDLIIEFGHGYPPPRSLEV
jgi:hypothetical protein